MHKVIAFVGTNPRPATYSFNGRIYRDDLFIGPLYEIAHASLPVDRLLVFATPAAAAACRERINVPPAILSVVDIPDGRNTAEMWEIFAAVTNAVGYDDAVTFDITHGLRSLPFLVFLAAAFLHKARRAHIRAVYYGALELGKGPDGTPQPAPVLELTDFVRLLDWLEASSQMERYGDATALAHLLRGAMPAYRSGEDPSVGLQRSYLGQAVTALERVSRALRLALPDEAMAICSTLPELLYRSAQAVSEWAPPFTVLAEEVARAYAPLALPQPRASGNAYAALQHEYAMVQWFLQRDLLVQAVTLAREWLVTWGLVQTGFDDVYERRHRATMERAFGGMLNQRRSRHTRTAVDDVRFTTGKSLLGSPAIHEALDLFAALSDVRNTLCHAGKRPNAATAEQLEKRARTHCAHLHRFLEHAALPAEA